MPDDKYEATAFCTNCGFEGPVTVTVGEPVYRATCPLCGNKHLRPVALRDWERKPSDA